MYSNILVRLYTYEGTSANMDSKPAQEGRSGKFLHQHAHNVSRRMKLWNTSSSNARKVTHIGHSLPIKQR